MRPWYSKWFLVCALVGVVGCKSTPATKKPDAPDAPASSTGDAGAPQTLDGGGAEAPARESAALGTETQHVAPPAVTTVPTANLSMASDAQSNFSRGHTALTGESKNYADALRYFDTAIEQDPQLAEAFFNKGYIHYRLNQTAEAERAYKRAIELKPTLAEAYANLACLYMNQREYSRSLELLDAGLKVIPQNPLLMNNRATALRLMGKNDEAIEEVRKLLKINATDVSAFNNLGRTYIGLKDYEMARLVFEKALLTAPTAKDDAYLHHNFGVALLGLKDPLRAQEQFDQALALRPDFVEALIDRGYLYLELQDFAKAEELLNRAVAEAPRSVTAKMNLGVALRGMGELDKAEQVYKEALELDPKNTSLLLNYGILLGDYKKSYLAAVDVYKRLREVVSGPEAERVDKLIREATVNHEREEKRKKRAQPKPEAAPTPAPDAPAPPATPAPTPAP